MGRLLGMKYNLKWDLRRALDNELYELSHGRAGKKQVNNHLIDVSETPILSELRKEQVRNEYGRNKELYRNEGSYGRDDRNARYYRGKEPGGYGGYGNYGQGYKRGYNKYKSYKGKYKKAYRGYGQNNYSRAYGYKRYRRY